MFKIVRYYHTLKYLKSIQIFFRVWYKVRKKPKFKIRNPKNEVKPSLNFFHAHHQPLQRSYQEDELITFSFLNIDKRYSLNNINWNDESSGKLWNYNLNYFDFLFAPNLSKQIKLEIVKEFINKQESLGSGMDSYPISIRGMNWIKFIIQEQINDIEIDKSLYSQYHLLARQLEYQVMGNHLLENAFSLLFASYYFRDDTFYRKSKKILKWQLLEQILKDGAHFELSPMYHQIMVLRMLDVINLLKNNSWKSDELLTVLEKKLAVMLGWLKQITFTDGSIPMVNDSAYDISPSSGYLFEYAEKLEVENIEIELGDSGYRTFKKGNYELFCDVGAIGPNYLPAHAHADSLNFILHVNGRPTIVDSGVSTYERGEYRDIERSTDAHNTVVVDERSSSEVWDVFRVARRAHSRLLVDIKDELSATHDGYFGSKGIITQRDFRVDENSILIKDRLFGKGVSKTGVTYFSIHFHPQCEIHETESDRAIETKEIRLEFPDAIRIEVLDYNLAIGFNQRVSSKKIRVFFEEEITTRIIIK